MALTKDGDLAEHLGVEVVRQNGVPVLRWRITEGLERAGQWEGRPASSTDEVLWDALRAMHVMRLGADAEAETLRDVADVVRRELLAERSMPRLTPKGGDRNEFARQVRRLAQRAVTERDDAADGGIDTPGYARPNGALEMANRVLVMLGQPPMLDGGRFAEVLDRQELVDALVRMRSGVSQWGQLLPDPSSTAARVEAATRDTAVQTLDTVLRLLSGEVYVDHRGNVMEPVVGEVSP